MSTSAYAVPFVISADVLIISAVLSGLALVVAGVDWTAAERRRAVLAAAVGLWGWFTLALFLGYDGAFRGVADRLPTIQYAIVIPIVVGLLLMWRSETIARIIEATPQSWLVGVQAYRLFGVIFVLHLADGRLPPQFALPAGWGDITVGLLAPVVAVMVARSSSGADNAVLAWNIFGLLDLVVAVGTGFLTSPSPFQTLALAAPNELISAFPLVLVPAFAVPLSVLLHAASLAKLTHASSTHRAAISSIR